MTESFRKAMSRLQDQNVFYRSAGAREMIVLGKEGMLRKDDGLDSELWLSLLRVALELLRDELDDDVKRFVTEILILMGAPRNKTGDFEAPPESEKAVDVDASRCRTKLNSEQEIPLIVSWQEKSW